jgi:2',3'-cyclic-nucleotide 2'-phosphodiesterase (5'-nucleotidase family)
MGLLFKKLMYIDASFILPHTPGYMLKIRNRNVALVGLLAVLSSCHSTQVPVRADYADYRITTDRQRDTSLVIMLAPYRDSVDRSMNAVVGIADKALDKKQPEGTLGNFMVDAFFYGAEKAFGVKPDVGVLNYGGIRLTQLPSGPVTRGKVFELMPFDNILVLQKVPGHVLQEFLDLTASKKGWPLHGITLEIRNGKATNVKINGAPLDPDKVYVLVNSDYVANGGDNAAMLKAIPQQNVGYLMRDAIFDYISYLKSQGKNISANEENRVYVP